MPKLTAERDGRTIVVSVSEFGNATSITKQVDGSVRLSIDGHFFDWSPGECQHLANFLREAADETQAKLWRESRAL